MRPISGSELAAPQALLHLHAVDARRAWISRCQGCNQPFDGEALVHRNRDPDVASGNRRGPPARDHADATTYFDMLQHLSVGGRGDGAHQ
jgi:hypothetical protein